MSVSKRAREGDICVLVDEDAVLVANTGAPLSRAGVISICKAHQSAKTSVVFDFDGVPDARLVQHIQDIELRRYRTNPNEIVSDQETEKEIGRDYDGRALWELLQNADDAMRVGTGDGFIGTKGLGFKSVLEVTDEPEVHSGPFHLRFSATENAALIRAINDNPRLLPPTFRIPHPCDPAPRVQQLMAAGYATVIRLPFRDERARARLGAVVERLEPHFLLLSAKLSRVRIVQGRSERILSVRRQQPGLADGWADLAVTGEPTVRWRRWVLRGAADAQGRVPVTAICLPLDASGALVPAAQPPPLHVYYPTNEVTGIAALVHVPFEVEGNRKRIRETTTDALDQQRLQDFATLVVRVAQDAPVPTTLAVFRGAAEGRDSSLMGRLRRQTWEAVRSAEFVPVIGRPPAAPKAVHTWRHWLGLVVKPSAPLVQGFRLLAPRLNTAANRAALERLGANSLPKEMHYRLLAQCRNDTEAACRRALWATHKAIKHSFFAPGESPKDFATIPFWMTSAGKPVSLAGDQPIVLTRDDDRRWPAWLPAHALSPSIKALVERFDQGKDPDWLRWTNGVVRDQAGFLSNVLAPFLRKQADAFWQESGWEVLEQIQTRIRNDVPFEEMTLWDDDPGVARNPLRDALVTAIKIPTVDGRWTPAPHCYAGEAWGGPSRFDCYFAPANSPAGASPVILPFPKWTARLRKKGQDWWKVILRWLGVSWEPKLRRLTSNPPQTPDGKSYWVLANLSGFRHVEHEWMIDLWPDIVSKDVGGVQAVRWAMTLKKQLNGRRCAYMPRNQKHSHQPECRWTSFAEYQLCKTAWMPVRKTRISTATVAAPVDAFQPDAGIEGVTPELWLKANSEGEMREMQLFLHRLGLQTTLPKDARSWVGWIKGLAQAVASAKPVDRTICGSLGTQPPLVQLSRRLFFRFLSHCDTNLPLTQAPVPCEVAVDGRDEVQFCPASEARHIDLDYLDGVEVRAALKRAGAKLFLLRLRSGNAATSKLGVKRLSEVITTASVPGPVNTVVGPEILGRLHERRRALMLVLDKPNFKLPDPLVCVDGLALQLTYMGQELPRVPVPGHKDQDGCAYVDVTRDPWHGLARVIAPAEADRDRIENLLRIDSTDALLERLRTYGVTQEDLDELEEDMERARAQHAAMASEGAEPSSETPSDADTGEDTGDETGAPGGPTVTDPPPPPPTGKPPPFAPKKVVRIPIDRKQTKAGMEGAASVSIEQVLAEIMQAAETVPSGSHTPTGPDPLSGRDAEMWLHACLRAAFPDRVHPLTKGADALVVGPGGKVLVEVKHSTSGLMFWSRLEVQLALTARENGMPYLMAVLTPGEGCEPYRICWLWNPLTDLLAVQRLVQWEAKLHSPLANNTWAVDEAAPPSLSGQSYAFRIALTQRFLDGHPVDDGSLAMLRTWLASRAKMAAE